MLVRRKFDVLEEIKRRPQLRLPASPLGSRDLGSWFSYPNLGNNSELAPTADRNYFVQIVVEADALLTGLACFITSAAGNVRSALYDASGVRIANRSTARAVEAGGLKTAFTTPILVPAGVYFGDLVFSSAAAKVAATIPLSPNGFVAGPGSGATAPSIEVPTGFSNTIPTISTY